MLEFCQEQLVHPCGPPITFASQGRMDHSRSWMGWIIEAQSALLDPSSLWDYSHVMFPSMFLNKVLSSGAHGCDLAICLVPSY